MRVTLVPQERPLNSLENDNKMRITLKCRVFSLHIEDIISEHRNESFLTHLHCQNLAIGRVDSEGVVKLQAPLRNVAGGWKLARIRTEPWPQATNKETLLLCPNPAVSGGADNQASLKLVNNDYYRQVDQSINQESKLRATCEPPSLDHFPTRA